MYERVLDTLVSTLEKAFSAVENAFMTDHLWVYTAGGTTVACSVENCVHWELGARRAVLKSVCILDEDITFCRKCAKSYDSLQSEVMYLHQYVSGKSIRNEYTVSLRASLKGTPDAWGSFYARLFLDMMGFGGMYTLEVEKATYEQNNALQLFASTGVTACATALQNFNPGAKLWEESASTSCLAYSLSEWNDKVLVLSGTPKKGLQATKDAREAELAAYLVSCPYVQYKDLLVMEVDANAVKYLLLKGQKALQITSLPSQQVLETAYVLHASDELSLCDAVETALAL